MEIKNTKSIFRLFLGSLSSLVLSVILLIITSIVMLLLALQYEILLPANFVETELSNLEDTFYENFNGDLLPINSSYVIIDLDFGVRESNMSDDDKIKTQNYLLDGSKSYYDSYKQISLSNGDILVVKYQLLARFSNPLLNKIIPYPEITLLIFVLCLIIVFSIITALRFSKKLKINLVPIIIASEKISQRDLDFDIQPSKIKEFNDSLVAIDNLKTELKLSLNKQWNEEEQKKSALSALAHDLKTPLTIIKGNSELLLEDDLSDDTLETILYIKQGAVTIEKYIEMLISALNDSNFNISKEDTSLESFIDDLKTDILPLCKTKNICLNLENKATTDTITIDTKLMHRVVMNIIDNAVRFSEKNATIDFIITEENSCFLFDILDNGKGFSTESLKKGMIEFYTEDTSRSYKHYGLGLSFAKKVIDLHNGFITICNIEKGAKVSIQVPKQI